MPKKLIPHPEGDLIRDFDTGESIQIMLDRNDHTFFFEYQGVTVSSKVYHELPSQARAALKAGNDLQWSTVIKVSANNGHVFASDRKLPTAQIDFSRFQWAYRKDGKLMQRTLAWYEKSIHFKEAQWVYGQTNYWRWDDHKINVFNPPIYDGDTAWLPYTEELWTGLKQIQEAIKVIQTRIYDIIATPEGTVMLALVGAGKMNLLEATTTKEEPPHAIE